MAAVDRPAVLVLLAARLLADRDAAWGRAMLGELPSVEGRVARWRFAAGCLRAALSAPVRRRGLAVAVTLLALADAAVVATALVRYPGLRAGAGIWFAVPTFLAVLAVYTLAAAALARRTSGLACPDHGRPGRRPARRCDLDGARGRHHPGCRRGHRASDPGRVPAHLPGRRRDRRPPRRLVRHPRRPDGRGALGLSGLVVFLAWTVDTVVRAGRPYDAGLVRDFHTSGAPDLATYAVSDNLGSGMVLLVVVPLLTVVLGLAGQGATLLLRRRLIPRNVIR